MRRLNLNSESGRIWAGMGGVLLMAAGAAVVATVVFSTDSPVGRVPVAQADHNTLTQAEIDALPNGTKILICHTEGNGSQHTIEPNSESMANAGHFDAPGNPLHAVGDVHDFIIEVEAQDPINDESECGAVAATPTATQAVATATLAIATATQQVEATSTPTTVPPTNTPEATATLAIATATQQVEATSTPTNTPEATATNTPVVPPTNTPEPTNTPVVPPTNTPVPLVVVEVQSAQATPPPTTAPLPPAAPLDAQAAPTTAPAPAVRALPSTGSGGYEDRSLGLIVGVAMILAGTSISFMAIRRQVR